MKHNYHQVFNAYLFKAIEKLWPTALKSILLDSQFQVIFKLLEGKCFILYKDFSIKVYVAFWIWKRSLWCHRRMFLL